jgi:hypothetical protein
MLLFNDVLLSKIRPFVFNNQVALFVPVLVFPTVRREEFQSYDFPTLGAREHPTQYDRRQRITSLSLGQ